VENSRAGNARSLRELASLATPMSLRVAATLRLADRITDTGTTAGDLAATTGTEPRALTRVLDHLVAVGVLCRTDNRYQVTELLRQLRTNHRRTDRTRRRPSPAPGHHHADRPRPHPPGIPAVIG
jgi:hypothetical protein